MSIIAYVNESTFTETGEYDEKYEVGRRLRLGQGNAGYADVSVLTATYDPQEDLTTVHVIPSVVQSSLVSVKLGPSGTNSEGDHGHTGYGDGGFIPASGFNSTQVADLISFLDSYQHRFTLTAGESLVQYDVVYQDVTASGKCKKAQQDGTSAEAEAFAMVMDTTIAQDASGRFLLSGIVTNSAWTWTPGAILWLSDTPGEMTETKPETGYSVKLGQALAATTVWFQPSGVIQSS